MEKESLKQMFLSRIDNDIKSKLKPEYYDLLDETIESVISGQSTIGNKIPKNDEECFIAIGYGLITRIKLFESLLKPLLNDPEKRVVNINYRGKAFTYKNFEKN